MSSTSLSTMQHAASDDEEIAEYVSEVTADDPAKIETVTNQVEKVHLEENFESDITTETETDKGTESESAESFVVLSAQQMSLISLKDAFFDITLNYNNFKSSIDSYRKILQEIDYESLKNEKNLKVQNELYAILREQKLGISEIIYGLNKNAGIPLKEIVLMQILNKRAIHMNSNISQYSGEFLSHASNKIVLNPTGLVRDYYNQISRGKRSRTRPITSINSFNKKYSAVLITQIDSINQVAVRSPSGNYNIFSWIDKLFSLFKNEDIQRFNSYR